MTPHLDETTRQITPVMLLARLIEPGELPDQWPPEANFILSALEAAGVTKPEFERRAAARCLYRSVAALRLFSDRAEAPPWIVYSRDFTARSMGFISKHRLNLGYGGVLHLRLPDQKMVQIDCTLHRCRQAPAGWFEGALHFNRAQSDLMERLRGKEVCRP